MPLHVVAVSLPCLPFVTKHDSARALITEREHGKSHAISAGAPDEWALRNGATHTLHLDPRHAPHTGLTRPVLLANRSTLYVGTDETPDGRIAWEKWSVRMNQETFDALMRW